MFSSSLSPPYMFLSHLFVPVWIFPCSNQNSLPLKLRSALGKALGITVAKSSLSSLSCMLVRRQGQSMIEGWEMHKSRPGLKLNSLWSFFLTSLTLAQTPALGGSSSGIAMTWSSCSAHSSVQGGECISKMTIWEYLGCKKNVCKSCTLTLKEWRLYSFFSAYNWFFQ